MSLFLEREIKIKFLRGLDEHCPSALPAMMELFYICAVQYASISTQNVASVSEVFSIII